MYCLLSDIMNQIQRCHAPDSTTLISLFAQLTITTWRQKEIALHY